MTTPTGVDVTRGELTLCVDSTCEETTLTTDEDIIDRPMDLDEGDEVSAVLDVPGSGRFTSSMTVVDVRPNGPDCGPVCDRADLTLQPHPHLPPGSTGSVGG